MLTMSRHLARLSHINVRVEQHGEERIKVVDLKLRMRAPLAMLDDFMDGLRAALFRPPEPPPARTAEQLFDAKDLPPLEPILPRFAELPAIKLATDMRGRLVTIEWGIGDPMEFDWSRARKFEVDLLCEAQGYVDITYTLSLYATPQQQANLYLALESTIAITIETGSDTPPLTQASLIDDEDSDGDDDPAPGDDGDTDDDPDPFAGSDLARNRQPEEAN